MSNDDAIAETSSEGADALEELRRRERELADFIDNAPVGLHWVDADGAILWANQAELDLLGYTREEYIGRHIAEFHADKDVINDMLRRLTNNETLHSYEARLRCKDGSIRYVLISSNVWREGGKFIHTRCFTRDITARKVSEEALRDHEYQFRALAETAQDAIITIDEDSTLLFVSQSTERIFGYAPEELLGKPLTMLMPEYLRHLHQAGIKRYAETGQKHIDWAAIELPGLHKDGREIPLEISFSEFISQGKRRFSGIARDTSDRKRAAREREALLLAERRTAEELREANRLKDEFLSTVSHELRTPLTAILGWAHLLRLGQLGEGGAVEALETIERNARAQSHLIDDLLDVSRIITGKLRLDVRQIDPGTFIESAIEAVRPAADAKNVRIQKVMDTGVVTVAADPARMQQVVWNLVSNAIKFTPKGGRVQVRLERINSHIEIAVSDTGVGIKPEFLPHVFERFRQADQTTTRQHSGLGLGLAIVRHLVDLHGGTVEAESTGEGHGATFIVRLPLVSVHQKTKRDERVHPTARDTRSSLDCPERLDGMKVLVVDDEVDTRTLLRAGLSQCGAEVTCVASAREALEVIEKERPALLVSDIGMPGEDGYELIRKVRALPAERGGRTPAIALTAYARTEDRLRALRAGYQMHVSKPVELAELVTVMASLVQRTV